MLHSRNVQTYGRGRRQPWKLCAVAWEWARKEGPQERPLHSGRGSFFPVGYRRRTYLVKITLDSICKAKTHVHLFPSRMVKQEKVSLG